MADKVVVITGASAGIGAALAEVVAARGGRPVLVARRRAELEKVAARCGAGAVVVVADVTRRADVQRVFDTAMEQCGRVDVWVNNAGRGITRAPSAITDEDLDDMMLVNVKSALYGMQVVLPHFRQRRRGQIVNVSSVLGRMPVAGIRAAYSAAKHALSALSTCLRVELQSEYPDIWVTTVYPGVVATDFGTNALHGGPDSRALPGAQPVAEVATVIADVIDRPQAEVYTRQEYKAQVAAYYAAADLAEIESRPPWAVSR